MKKAIAYFLMVVLIVISFPVTIIYQIWSTGRMQAILLDKWIYRNLM